MSVYFARVGRYIKIGASDNPERRVARLFSSATLYCKPEDCPTNRASRELLAVIPGGTNTEAACHAALEDFRDTGEFFIDEPEVRIFIERAAAGDFTRVARPAGEWRSPYVEQPHPSIANLFKGAA